MTPEVMFYIAAIAAAILLLILIAVIIAFAKTKGELRGALEENRKYKSKLVKMDNAYKDAIRNRDNIVSMHEELKDEYENVNRIAFTDSLTDLPNKQQFSVIMDGIMETARDGERFGLCLFRITNYDRITNIGGYLAGDDFLVDFATRVKANLEDDDFLARIGNDEFAILSQNFLSNEDYEKKLGKLYRILTAPLETGGAELIPSIAMAATKAPTDGNTTQLLSLNARLTLSIALNENEKKVYFFKNEYAENAMQRLEITSALTEASKNDSFAYRLGAVTDLRSNSSASFEIMPVWEDEAYGTLYPSQYLEFAEDTDIAKTLFKSLFEKACEKQSIFAKAGYKDISIIVPCFATNFIDDDFVKIVYNILETSDATPDRLIIAIKETVISANKDASIALMKKIEKLGIRFMLDDFGGGTSSLKILMSAPVSIVRLSSDFLGGDNRLDAEECIHSVVELLHSAKAKLIIPSVADDETEAALKKLKVDYASGSLYNGYMETELALALVRMSKK